MVWGWLGPQVVSGVFVRPPGPFRGHRRPQWGDQCMVAKQGFGYFGVRISHPNGFRAQKLAFGTFQGPKNKVWQWSFPGVPKLSQTNNKLGFQPKKPPQNHPPKDMPNTTDLPGTKTRCTEPCLQAPPKERWKNYGNTIEIWVLLVQGQA